LQLAQGERFAFGGFGDVYSAKWRGRLVAVKRLNDAKLKDPEARRLMLLECARHHDLVHPCVLHAFGIVDDGDWLANVTPLMLHGSVQQAYEMLAEDGIWVRKVGLLYNFVKLQDPSAYVLPACLLLAVADDCCAACAFFTPTIRQLAWH
jgi:serine/threonine protein kinase